MIAYSVSGKADADCTKELTAREIYMGSLSDPIVSGELKKWHKITITFEGPNTSENASTNPFLDYRLNVTFSGPNGETYQVPGYYAADGEAGESGANSGNKWRVHFSPDAIGQWSYSVSFRTGTNVAISDNASAGSATSFDGTNGTFDIVASDKTGKDNRAKGRLKYVGEHYLQWAETGDYFIKIGADAPENFLAYDDIDNTPNSGGRRKSWAPHVQDWNTGDPTWKGGKGKGIIGAINYLSEEGQNVFSFLTMNINGDDKNVFPYISDNSGDRTRFDCSKLDQWEVIFEHGDRKGMYLHFKTQETENDQLLDAGDLGTQRKIYYRELIARFGHHLALNWNLGEENTNTETQRKAFAQYFHDHDPYLHNIVLHTFPTKQQNIYPALLGNASKLTGVSIQKDWDEVHEEVKKWVEQSDGAGKKWVVANDEQGNAEIGVPHDNYTGSPSQHDIRKDVLWGTLMAGGGGVEYYFGYQLPHSDLNAQDFRSRSNMWKYNKHAVDFFTDFNIPFWEMTSNDDLTSSNSDYCFAKEDDTYVIYLRNGGTTNINLSGANGQFYVSWYNPRTGGELQQGTVANISGGMPGESIGEAPTEQSNDWVVLLTKFPQSQDPFIAISNIGQDDQYNEGESVLIKVNVFEGTKTIDKVTFLEGNNVIGIDETGTEYSYTWTAPTAGTYILSAQLEMTDGSKVISAPVNISVVTGGTGTPCNVPFEEKDGLLVMEAESANVSGTSWQLMSSKQGFTGQGYIQYTGNNSYGSVKTQETIEYRFKINKTGTYRIVGRHDRDRGGNADEGNDAWMKVLGADDFYADCNNCERWWPRGSGLTPNPTGEAGRNGFFKYYVCCNSSWSYLTATGEEVPRHVFYARFDSPGVYTLQIAGRSKGYLVDRFVMYHSDVSASTAEDTSTIETSCQTAGNGLQVAWLSPAEGAVFNEGSNVAFRVRATDDDGSVTSVAFFDNGELVDKTPSVIGDDYRIDVEGLTVGDHLLQVIATDDEGNTKTSDRNIQIEYIPVFTALAVTPSDNVTITAGGSIQFGTVALDQIGVPMSEQPIINWTSVGGGSIDNNGLFVIGNDEEGPFEVIAESNGITEAVPVSVSDIIYAINCGGGTYSSVEGIEFEADQYFTGGETFSKELNASNTNDPILYNTQRYDLASYDLPVTNGNYQVELFFSEVFYQEVGRRVFDVRLENELVIDDLDVVGETGGRGIAKNYIFDITVQDGNLDIELEKVIEFPFINAILVTRGNDTGEPEPVLTSIHIAPSGPFAISIGESLQLEAIGFDQEGKPMESQPTIFWTSNSEAVAVVNETGWITALSEGTTTITATDGEFTDEVMIEVSALTVELTIELVATSTSSTTILLDWSIDQEIDDGVFEIWRSQKDESPDDAENEGEILSVTVPATGAKNYSFTDGIDIPLSSGITYHYSVRYKKN